MRNRKIAVGQVIPSSTDIFKCTASGAMEWEGFLTPGKGVARKATEDVVDQIISSQSLTRYDYLLTTRLTAGQHVSRSPIPDENISSV